MMGAPLAVLQARGDFYIRLTKKLFFSILIIMLVIRMQRVGRRNDPAFRVVLTEKRSKPKSGEHEILGSYHPKTKETVLKNERISYWMSKGAQVSATVHNLLIAKKVMEGKAIPVVKMLIKAANPQESSAATVSS